MFGMGKKIDTKAIAEEIKEGKAVLVDVRGTGEWQSGHAKDAMHISIDRIMGGDVPTKDKNKTVYLYCQSGGRASMAAQHLKSRGYTVENLGGLNAWRSAGGAVELG